MRILLLGKYGQLGWELQRTLPVVGEVNAFDRDEIDLIKTDSFRDVLGALPWDVLVNASAYTAVDQAEIEKETAKRVNTDAPRIMAEEARRRAAIFIHFSTDYVFDGLKNQPYVETDLPNPCNYYGESKLEGERAIQDVGGFFFIFRTSWVYSLRGDNFVTNVIKWSNQMKVLRIVTDQTGCPIWARVLAELTSQALCRMISLGSEWTSTHSGIYHLASMDYVSRFDLARHIVHTLNIPVKVMPALTRDFPSPVTRPSFSAMLSSHFTEVFNIRVPAWREMLENALKSEM